MSVARRGLLIDAAIDFDLDRGYGAKAVGEGEGVVEDADAVAVDVMAEDVGNNVGEVFLGEELLFVTKFYDAFGHFVHRLIIQLNAEGFEVLADVGFAGGFAEGVLTGTAEALGNERVAVEVTLGVAVSVYTGALGEDVLACDGLVGGDMDAGVGLDAFADAIDASFADGGAIVELVVDDGHGAAECGVAGAFAEAIDGDVHATDASANGHVGVRYGQTVVVVGVEIEMEFGVALGHATAKFEGRFGVKDAERVGQHEAADGQVTERVDEGEDVVRRIVYAVGPILEVEIDGDAGFIGLPNLFGDVGGVLFGSPAELLCEVAQGTLAEQVHRTATGVANPGERPSAIDKSEHFEAVEASGFVGPLSNAPDGLQFAVRDTRGGDLEAVYIQFFDE